MYIYIFDRKLVNWCIISNDGHLTQNPNFLIEINALSPFCFGDSSRIFYPSSSPFCSASSEAKTYRSEDADLHMGSNETYCFCITWFPFLSENSRKSLHVKFSFFIKNCITSGKNRGKCRPSCFCSFRISGDVFIFSVGEDGLERDSLREELSRFTIQQSNSAYFWG